VSDFQAEVKQRIVATAGNHELKRDAAAFMRSSFLARYSYNFEWLGRPIIQYPQDMVAVQEIIWQVRPDLIIETGIAHGGSLILSASMLALLDLCDAVEAGISFNPAISKRSVLGIDIDIREHNRLAIEAHPLASRIHMIEGSSVAPDVISSVYERASQYERILVFLDSNHTHEHVLAELNAYAGLTSIGSYCVVFDTVVEDLPSDFFADRPWNPQNNPKSALREYLSQHTEFEIDTNMQDKLLISVAPNGYLRRTK
jgi:cephalosporin hydroxylase